MRTQGTRTVVRAVGLDGSAMREVATFDHEPDLGPVASRIRLPHGDWVLLAGPIGDTPAGASGSGAPVLIDIATGERIELRNLPGY